jgi:ribosome-binding factor A
MDADLGGLLAVFATAIVCTAIGIAIGRLWPVSPPQKPTIEVRIDTVTVTQVRITPDLSIARIYVSLMMIGGGTKEELLQLIRENTADLRRRLGLREGKQLRIIPHLEFYLDDSLDYIENIERLLKQ